MTFRRRLVVLSFLAAFGGAVGCTEGETPPPSSGGADGGVDGKNDGFGFPNLEFPAESHCRSEFRRCRLDVDFGESWGATGIRFQTEGSQLTARAYVEGSSTEGLRVRLYYSETEVRSLADATRLETGSIAVDETGFGAGFVMEMNAAVSEPLDGYLYLAVAGQPGTIKAFEAR